MEIILFEPEIPPNTGNIARLSAGWGLKLNLIEPLGFSLDDKYLKRAGLDYWPFVALKVWPNWPSFKLSWAENGGGKLIGSSARKGKIYYSRPYKESDGLVFGPETRGLPKEICLQLDDMVKIPIKNEIRSFNLATSVGIIVSEALRQLAHE